jgi:dihydrolipoamide dehydrogenase
LILLQAEQRHQIKWLSRFKGDEKELKMERYTAVVIGAGPAGHSCAVRMAQLGAKVAVVERDYVGGICTNWGCTPSKSMIESAKVARTVKESAKYGIDVSDFKIDFKRVAARRDTVIFRSRQSIMDLLRHHGVDIYLGEAEVAEPGIIKVRAGKLDFDGEQMHYSGEVIEIFGDHIILATGSKPLIPGFVDPNDPFIVSSNRLIAIGELPETLTIVGGGVIGLEFATIFSNLGSKVTIIELMDRLLAAMDPNVSTEITRLMEANGVTVLASHEVKGIENGVVKITNLQTSETLEIESKATLIAVGRQAVVNQAMLDKLNVEYTKFGLTVNDYMQTNCPGVWAIGDATGKSILAHVGIQQGLVCAENVMRRPGEPLREMDYEVIPAVVYSIPEIVSVGTVPQSLNGVSVFKVPFAVNLRARIEAFDDGFIKIWVRKNRIIAAQAIGHNASEIMQELANMIALKTPINEVAEIIHAHPTYSEITRSVLEYALGRHVDFYLKEPVKEPTTAAS